jgi:serine/threonine protein kinase
MAETEMQSAEDVFYDALEIKDDGERAAFIKRACLDNAQLLATVQQMIAAQPDADSFFQERVPTLPLAIQLLEEFPQEGRAEQSAGKEGSLDETAGTQIGPYKVLEKLGEGGCGTVYRAEQEEPIRRQVALKVIKLGMDTKNVIARFRAEQQALALMDHPNIARVFDAGATATGRPYFVMELVHGARLTRYCDENRLEIRERLKLFIEVCHAVQHAHQKGVIHRDIKPSNILVTIHDGAPVPKVIDFGIAKATQGHLTETTLSTGFERFIGTPAYMSPEQAEMGGLRVDTRTDIYSLGVLLYELLTGRTPFDQKKLINSGLDGMRRTLREAEPRPPSKLVTALSKGESTETAKRCEMEPKRLVSTLRGDLDWIIMKALEKDPSRRYETVNGLARDIERYLDNEPVSARPPSRLYRLQKLVRRNKVVFAAGAVVAFALASGLGVSTWLLLRERKLHARAVAAEREESRLRFIAERGLATEAELRREAEAREKLTQAAALIERGMFSEADALAAQLPLEQSAMEGASVFRTLGEWNAGQQKWSAARDRFLLLDHASRTDDPGYTSLDSTRTAVTIVECGDRRQYQKYCFDTIKRFASTADPVVAERTFKNCLLLPSSEALIRALEPLVQLAQKSLENEDFSTNNSGWPIPWRCLSLALWEYRVGNFSEAIVWSHRCLETGSPQGSRFATARIVMGMALYRLGESEAAWSELGQARTSVEDIFKSPLELGNRADGFWFDWVLARILLREATDLIGPAPVSSR